MNDSKFKVGNLIVGKDSNNEVYANDIGIVLSVIEEMDTYNLYWFRYSDCCGDFNNHFGSFTIHFANKHYKVLK